VEKSQAGFGTRLKKSGTLQIEMASLSSNGERTVAHKESDHFIQLEQPELVIGANSRCFVYRQVIRRFTMKRFNPKPKFVRVVFWIGGSLGGSSSCWPLLTA